MDLQDCDDVTAAAIENLLGEYDWKSLSSDKAITWDFISKNLDKPWDWKDLSGNSAITWDVIIENLNLPWDWAVIGLRCGAAWKKISDPKIPWDLIREAVGESWTDLLGRSFSQSR